jgi:hypothetical protein
VGSSESLEEEELVDGDSTAWVHREEPIVGSLASSAEVELGTHGASVSSSASLVECEMARILASVVGEE